MFHLVTRWTDRAAFEAWHGSEAHRGSHSFIPPGLKLDATFTRLEIIERLDERSDLAPLEHQLQDAVPLLAQFAGRTQGFCLLVFRSNGTCVLANAALAARLGRAPQHVSGRSWKEFVIEADVPGLERAIAAASRFESLVLNFAGADGLPFTLQTLVDVRPDVVVLVGEPVVEHEHRLSQELFRLNNELTVLNREHNREHRLLSQAHAELERVHRDLAQSHWHLRKIQEVLPICVGCHKVKTGDGQWDDLVRFFQEHSKFLSHGYCPECFAEAMASLAGDVEPQR